MRARVPVPRPPAHRLPPAIDPAQPIRSADPPAPAGPAAADRLEPFASVVADGGGAAAPERGAVTVEAALALCSLAVFLAVAIGSIGAVAASVRCIDASRELARLAARGEPERGHAIAAAIAPAGARSTLVVHGHDVIAEVSTELLSPLPLVISGRAVAALEPGSIPT